MRAIIYIIITTIITILLESIILLNSKLIFLTPLLIVTSIPIFYYLLPNKKTYFFIMILLALFFDLKYSQIFLYNTLFILLASYLVAIILDKGIPSIVMTLVMTLFLLITYEIYLELGNYLFLHQPFMINNILIGTRNVLLVGFLYNIFTYYTLLKSRKKY